MVRQCGLVPFNDQVIVKAQDREEKTPGGIVLPDSARKSAKGIVVGVGPGWKSNDGASRLALDVKLNDVVYYRENQGEYVINDGVEDYIVVSAANILCKVKN